MNQRIAIIDIGSNSTNLLIADGDITVIRELAVTQLGTGVSATKQFAEADVQRTLLQLGRYREIIHAHHVDIIVPVATAAVRSATNATLFLSAAQEILGTRVEVVSGEQEGHLAFLGAQHQLSLPPGTNKIGVIDIGGGSTEFVVGDVMNSTSPQAMSIPLGARNLTERELHSNPPRPEELTNAIGAMIDEVDDVMRLMPDLVECDEIIGVAGTIVTVAMVELGLAEFDAKLLHGMLLTKNAAEDVFRTLATEPLADRIHNPGLALDRAEIIVGGCCALVGIMRKLQRGHIIISTSTLLDGVALLYSQATARGDTTDAFARFIQDFSTGGK